MGQREIGARVAAAAGQHLNRQLGVLELYNRLLLAQKGPAAATSEHQARFAATLGTARALCQQLLASGGMQPLRFQGVSLSELLRRQGPRLQRLLGPAIRLEAQCRSTSPLIWVDPRWIAWMLEELVKNAREASKNGGRVWITLETIEAATPNGAEPQRCVCLSVSDTGRGMSPEAQARVGELFFTTKPGNHAGLGLASVSGLMKEHGGWLEMASAPRCGTRARLVFPVATRPPPTVPSRLQRRASELTASL